MSILINDVSKNFANGRCVLKNIDINIKSGVFGIVGYNSSGKSTLIKIITTLMEPSSGCVKLFGKDMSKRKDSDIASTIGYMPQTFSFYEQYTIKDFMYYMAKMHGIKRTLRNKRIENVLKSVLLYEDRNLKFFELTQGMRSRVGIAQAMLNNPKILVLDDPISNVENYEKHLIKELLLDYGKDNIVLISTRSALDLEGLASHIAVMNKGNLCFNGSVEKLLENAREKVWSSNVGEFLDVARLEGIHKVVSFNKYGKDYYARVISDVKPYKDSKNIKATLEDAFLYCLYTS